MVEDRSRGGQITEGGRRKASGQAGPGTACGWIHIKMVIYIQQGTMLSFYSHGHVSCYVLGTLRARCPA